MGENLLLDLYNQNKGKISDKWSLYLSEYDRLFSCAREKPISLLEIGIQNGGSLKIWGDYFPKATHILGCDINPLCKNLEYEDSRIRVFVGDANDPLVYKKLIQVENKFDFIIDDGSHTSSDIIKTFSLYFNNLNKDGIFIIEDLHCSYLDSFEGGLHYPYSSISFLKIIADIVNHEHWGVKKTPSQLLKGFCEKYFISIDEQMLKEIHSIEFVNSMCIIRKSNEARNTLGHRIITGAIETAAPSHSHLNGMPFKFDEDNCDQSNNPWSIRELSPGEAISQLEIDLSEREQEITQLTQAASEREQEIFMLEKSLAEYKELLDAMELTLSWRITRPIRFVRTFFKNFRARNLHITTMKMSENSFYEPEDGLTSRVEDLDLILSEDPAFLALSGTNNQNRNSKLPSILKDESKLIAFYLPQYHEVPENSEWWGKGFTEWTNVRKAQPNFEGHYQPHIPGKLGYYDLSSVEVMHDQAEMAKLFGVYGFCFYYYWFSGRKILERPLENFLHSNVEIKFCLCWANENWTRTWDGDTKSVLMHQKYESSDPEYFLESLVPFFKDGRYITVDGCPLLVVYRAKDIPNTLEIFEKWRSLAKKYGFKDLHIAAVDFYDIESPNEVGADALVEFPPHKFNGPNSVPDKAPQFTNENFSGGLIDYDKVIAQSANRLAPDFRLYRGVMPSWDNTARRQDNPVIVVNESPKKFGAWLSFIRAYTRHEIKSKDDNFIFVNAWNEWGEGCHLEPDLRHGTAYLDQLLRSAYYSEESQALNNLQSELFKKIIVNCKVDQEEGGDVKLLPEQLSYMRKLYKQRPQSAFVQSVKVALNGNDRLYQMARRIYRFIYCRSQG